MANNCLITKLKGIVNNNNLPFFDTIVVKIKGNKTGSGIQLFHMLEQGGIQLNGDPGMGYNYDTLDPVHNPFTVINNNGVTLKNNTETTLNTFIGNKHILTNFKGLRQYWLTAGGVNYYYNYDHSSTFVDKDQYIDLKDFEYCLNLTELDLQFMSTTGKLTDLCKLTNLQTLGLSRGNYTGDIIDFVQGLIDNGKSTTGSIRFKYIAWDFDRQTYNRIYLNGNNIGNETDSETNPQTIEWESYTKIIYKNSNRHNIYCVGYTDNEIATKTASGGDWDGYTVYRRD